MIRKTEGIVLSTRKFQESSLLVTLFTREYGKMNFIVQGIRSARSVKRHSYFQPMSCIEVVMYVKESRDLQKITESNLKIFWTHLQTDPRRIALGIVGIELFDKAVKEQEQNYPLYDFLKQYLLALDHFEDRLIHHFLYFLVHLSQPLGLFPRLEAENLDRRLYFDTANGRVINVPVNENIDEKFIQLLESSPLTCREISFTNEQKKQIISLMMEYYRLHLEGFREPDSLEVFREVLG